MPELAPGQLGRQLLRGDLHTGDHALEHGDQRGTVGLPGGDPAQHPPIIPRPAIQRGTASVPARPSALAHGSRASRAGGGDEQPGEEHRRAVRHRSAPAARDQHRRRQGAAEQRGEQAGDRPTPPRSPRRAPLRRGRTASRRPPPALQAPATCTTRCAAAATVAPSTPCQTAEPPTGIRSSSATGSARVSASGSRRARTSTAPAVTASQPRASSRGTQRHDTTSAPDPSPTPAQATATPASPRRRHPRAPPQPAQEQAGTATGEQAGGGEQHGSDRHRRGHAAIVGVGAPRAPEFPPGCGRPTWYGDNPPVVGTDPWAVAPGSMVGWRVPRRRRLRGADNDRTAADEPCSA